MVIGIWLHRTKMAQNVKEFVKRPFIRDLAIGYVLRIVLAIIVSNLLGNVLQIIRRKLNPRCRNPILWWCLYCFAWLQPILEELVFRWSHHWLFQKNRWMSQCVDYHPQLVFILYFPFLVMEVALVDVTLLYVPLTIPIVGMYRYYKNNIVASITMHFINNFIAFYF